MKTTSLMAGASRFAHFAGLARPTRRASEDDKQGRRADEDEDDQPRGKRGSRADEDDEDQPQGKRGSRADDDEHDDDQPRGKRGNRADDDEDEDDQPRGKRGKRGSRADDDDDDDDQPSGKRGSRADDDDDDDDQPRGKRGSRADDDSDDDDESEMKGKGAAAQARRREQARIAHILGHKAAASNIALALSLACETRMTRREAVAVLKGQADRGGGRDGGHRNRHARADRQGLNPTLGSDSEAPRGAQAVAASWDGAFARAGVATKQTR